MDWQTPAVVAVVLLALAYVARRTLRTWRGRGAGCGGACKCSSEAQPPAGPLIGADELTARLRRRQ
jgi:hypothetical protein